jgi:hypothetical protein
MVKPSNEAVTTLPLYARGLTPLNLVRGGTGSRLLKSSSQLPEKVTVLLIEDTK